MEQSAYEALMIGVSVFVFVIALTAGVMLMTNILDMVNYANNTAIVGMNGTIAQETGEVQERTYKGYELLTYYRKLLKDNEKEDDSQNKTVNFMVKLTVNGNETSLENYVEYKTASNYMNKVFEMSYKGNIDGIDTYVFLLKQENEK